MAILDTLAELKEYFKGWHTKFYEELHPGVSEISNKYTELESSITNNYFNKTQSDKKYLIKQEVNNSEYSNDYLLIDPTKTNKQYIQENLTKYSDMLKAMYNPSLSLISNKSNIRQYKYWGDYTLMSRFGALRVLDIGFDGEYTINQSCYRNRTNNECAASINRAKENTSAYAFKIPSNDIVLFYDDLGRNYYIDKNGTQYWLLSKLAKEDEPLGGSGSFTLPTGHLITMRTFGEKNPLVVKEAHSNEKITGHLPEGAGTYIQMQWSNTNYTQSDEYLTLGDPVQMFGTIMWVAKNKTSDNDG